MYFILPNAQSLSAVIDPTITFSAIFMLEVPLIQHRCRSYIVDHELSPEKPPARVTLKPTKTVLLRDFPKKNPSCTTCTYALRPAKKKGHRVISHESNHWVMTSFAVLREVYHDAASRPGLH